MLQKNIPECGRNVNANFTPNLEQLRETVEFPPTEYPLQNLDEIDGFRDLIYPPAIDGMAQMLEARNEKRDCGIKDYLLYKLMMRRAACRKNALTYTHRAEEITTAMLHYGWEWWRKPIMYFSCQKSIAGNRRCGIIAALNLPIKGVIFHKDQRLTLQEFKHRHELNRLFTQFDTGIPVAGKVKLKSLWANGY